MATCSYCRREFNISEARKFIGRRFGAGTYDDQYPNGDVCQDCAFEELGAAEATWNEMITLPGDWDDD